MRHHTPHIHNSHTVVSYSDETASCSYVIAQPIAIFKRKYAFIRGNHDHYNVPCAPSPSPSPCSNKEIDEFGSFIGSKVSANIRALASSHQPRPGSSSSAQHKQPPPHKTSSRRKSSPVANHKVPAADPPSQPTPEPSAPVPVKPPGPPRPAVKFPRLNPTGSAFRPPVGALGGKSPIKSPRPPLASSLNVCASCGGWLSCAVRMLCSE